MTLASGQPAQWSSKLSFTIAAIGSSVGLGNLWRFSAEAGTNGGGAFIGVYLLCVLLIGIPAMMAEFLVGRAGSGSSALYTSTDLARRSAKSSVWGIGGLLGILSSFLIVSFYCVIAAWVMAYVPKFLTGAFDGQTPLEIAAQFDALITSPVDLLGWFLGFAGLTIWLVARGVNRGLELTSKILMPAFFLLLLGLSCFSLIKGWQSGGTTQALNFMFAPDFSKLSGSVAVSALGQAFFSLGIGMAIMITYGSYLPKEVSIPRAAFVVGISDTLVALTAGLAIFPIVFQFGLDFSAGAGLFFQTLPTALVTTPGGNLVGAAFFCMAFFAALTTAVSLLEPLVAHASEQFGLAKSRAAMSCGAAMIAVGSACLVSSSFLDFLDTGLTAPILLPLSALGVVVFVGWRLEDSILRGEMGEADIALGKLLLLLVKYVAPVMICVILVSGVFGAYFA